MRTTKSHPRLLFVSITVLVGIALLLVLAIDRQPPDPSVSAAEIPVELLDSPPVNNVVIDPPPVTVMQGQPELGH